MTRTIADGRPARTSRTGDPYGPIIADFRAAMTMLKCASSERVLRLGLSMAQLNILLTLQRNGEMTMSHLAELLNVSLSNATGLIDRIEERGYVERDRVPHDRRIVVIRLTQQGERILDEMEALSDELLRSVLKSIGPARLDAIGQTFSALRTAVSDVTGGISADRHTAAIPPPPSPRPRKD